MHPSVVKEPGRRSKTPIAPPGVMRADGAISHPLRETDVDLGPHGPGSFPPACTLLSCTYHASHPPSSSRSKPLGRPPIPTFPPTSSIQWNRNATPPRLGATAGHTPPASATAAAARVPSRLRAVSRDGEITLAFIERRFSLSSWVAYAAYPESKKVASPWSPAASTWLCCDGRVVSYCNADHRTEDPRDATPGQAADSLANAADLRKSGLGPGAAYGPHTTAEKMTLAGPAAAMTVCVPAVAPSGPRAASQSADPRIAGIEKRMGITRWQRPQRCTRNLLSCACRDAPRALSEGLFAALHCHRDASFSSAEAVRYDNSNDLSPHIRSAVGAGPRARNTGRAVLTSGAR
jgi:hypothetical protein